MLLKASSVALVCWLVVAGTVAQGSQQHKQQHVAASGSAPLLQLAAPVAGQLQKRNTQDNSAQGTGFHHGHHHHGNHHLQGAGGLAGGALGAGGLAGGGLGHGHHGHGKFFMYSHQPEHKHYEFGFKRGNDKHVVERYEKGGPHHNFKSKFRWHDKHGGHGERYWDYNHGDHHNSDGGDDGGSGDGHHAGDHHHDDHHHHDDSHHGYHSEPVPKFAQPESGASRDAYRPRRKSNENQHKTSGFNKKPTRMDKKTFSGPKEQELFSSPMMSLQQPKVKSQGTADSNAAFNDMLGFDPFQPPEILKDHSSVGGLSSGVAPTPSYQPTTRPPTISKPYFSRSGKSKSKKYESSASDIKRGSSEEVPKLAFDLDSGKVYDEKTGKWFRLVAE